MNALSESVAAEVDEALRAALADPGFAAALYAAGAALVLEGRIGAGCGPASAGA